MKTENEKRFNEVLNGVVNSKLSKTKFHWEMDNLAIAIKESANDVIVKLSSETTGEDIRNCIDKCDRIMTLCGAISDKVELYDMDFERIIELSETKKRIEQEAEQIAVNN